MINKLSINLLGGLKIESEVLGAIVLGRKYKLLLAGLALSGPEGITREKLIDLLWGDCQEKQARVNLRQALSAVRKSLGQISACLSSTHTIVKLNSDEYWCDLDYFEECARSDELLVLHEGLSYFRGDLLAGVQIKEDAFEDWIRPRRERIHHLAVHVAEKLMRHYAGLKDLDSIAEVALQLLRIDQLHDQAQYELIYTYIRQGRRAAAHKQYKSYRKRLKQEFGLIPAQEITRLVQVSLEQAEGKQVSGYGLEAANDEQESEHSVSLDLSLPVLPSIAVLPFINLLGDTAHNYFSRAFTENITVALAKIPQLFIVSHSSISIYETGSRDIHQIGREQGVQYLLEGTIQKSASHLRLSLQMTDSLTGQCAWAEHFEKPLEDFFDLLDDITREVVVALQVKLTEGEQARIWASTTDNLQAWDLTVRASALLSHHIREDTSTARVLLEQAVKLDPEYVVAWCKLGWCHWSDARHHWSQSVESSLKQANSMAVKASTLNLSAAEPFALMAMIALQQAQFDDVVSNSKKAVERAGCDSFIYAISAMAISYCKRVPEAIRNIKYAMRLSPIFPEWYKMTLGRAYYLNKNYEQAISLLRTCRPYDGFYQFPVILIASLLKLQRKDDALNIARKAVKEEPDFSISKWLAPQKFKAKADLTAITSALRSLGLPD